MRCEQRSWRVFIEAKKISVYTRESKYDELAGFDMVCVDGGWMEVNEVLCEVDGHEDVSLVDNQML